MVPSQTLKYLLNCVIDLRNGQQLLIVLLGEMLKRFKPGISTSFASGKHHGKMLYLNAQVQDFQGH